MPTHPKCQKQFPANNTHGHWQDERGYWHHGRRLTAAEKDQIFGGRS